MATAPAKDPQLGDNRPPLITATMLGKDHRELVAAVDGVIAGAGTVPAVIEDEDDISTAREAVRAIMAEAKRVEALREDIKRPYLDAERVVQSFFATMTQRLTAQKAEIEKRAKTYLDLKAKRERDEREAEERRRREEEARRAAEAAEARRKADEARRAEEEAAARAARARQEAEERERREAEAARRRQEEAAEADRAEIARKDREAREAREREAAETNRIAQQEADAARREREDSERDERRREEEARAAAAKTHEAARAAEAKPADLARTRATGGGMATLAQLWDYEITDYAEIDLEQLRPHLKREDVEKAIRAHIRVNKDKVALRGVRIFDKSRAQFYGFTEAQDAEAARALAQATRWGRDTGIGAALAVAKMFASTGGTAAECVRAIEDLQIMLAEVTPQPSKGN